MPVDKERLAQTIQDLKRRRDELRVQLHLAKAEAKEEWEKAEGKWAKLQEHADRIKAQAGDAASDISEASSILAEELGQAYGRIRERLKQEKRD